MLSRVEGGVIRGEVLSRGRCCPEGKVLSRGREVL